MLGFLHDSDGERLPLFVPSTARAFSLPGRAPERPCWWPIDCRHGRAVFRSNSPRDLLIWDLITGDQRRLLAPAACKSGIWNAAVVCAADGCDHRDCQGGAFRVVLIHNTDGRWVTSAWVYSSASGAWGEPTSLDRHDLWIKPTGLVIARNTLLYFRCGPGCIVEYDIASHDLMVIDGPVVFQAFPDGIFLTLVDEGVLGVAGVRSYSYLHLWSRAARETSDKGWVQSRVIDLRSLLPIETGTSFIYPEAKVVGFAAQTNVIFISITSGSFAIDLQSGRVRKVCDWEISHTLFPVFGFYTPGRQNRIAAPDQGSASHGPGVV